MNPVAWTTPSVTLAAADFWIIADGERYGDDRAELEVHSDLGSPTYTTLELVWREREREMRFFIYLYADPTSWWSAEMRTYDGQPAGDWLFYNGALFFKSPIGQVYRHDVDLTNQTSDEFRGELHLHGLALSTTLRGS